MRYYEIENRSDAHFSPAVPRGTNIKTPGGCPQCCKLPLGIGPPDIVQVKDSEVNGVVLTTSWGFGVVSIELLELLGKDEIDCLKLGKLAVPSGNIINEYNTFVGVERVILRGNRESEHQICIACGSLIYTYLPRESPYLTLSQVTSGRSIYEIESMQLLVNESIRERIGDRWSDKISFYEVPILAAPLDGLPIDLRLWPTSEQLVGYKPNPPSWKKR